MPKTTKTELEMAEAAERFPDDPDRAHALQVARRFKNSWLELAEVLVQVRGAGHWRRWGYDSFEAYGKGELKLRQETMEKLTGSFQFLQKRAPQVLARDGVEAPLPSLESVNFLRKAEQVAETKPEVPRARLDELFTRVVDEAQPAAKVSKEFKEEFFPVPVDDQRDRDTNAVRSLATRLSDLLAATNAAPERPAAAARIALGDLVAALPSKEKAEKKAKKAALAAELKGDAPPKPDE